MSVKPAKFKTSVLIIGGGLSGLSLAGVLGAAGVEVICLDRDPPAAQLLQKYDGRTTAISYGSHKVLQAADVWNALEAECEPILDIRVVDGNCPFYLHFASDTDGKGAPFGWIVENRALRQKLFANLKRFKTVRLLAPVEIKKFIRDREQVGVVLKDGTTITAPLMVGADGKQSAVRSWLGIEVKKTDYHQTAIVCNVVHERDHENVAVEHFRASGPFAVLPMTKSDTGEFRSSIVWSEHGGDAAEIIKLPSAQFDRRLQELFGDDLGRVHHVSPPMCYPLGLMHAESYIGERVALMAEAAHAVHPIAGQGLNLSMRDIAVLAELVVEHAKLGLDIGSATLLARYEKQRRSDVLLMARVTDSLVRLFSNDYKTVAVVRGLGLGMVQKIPFLKAYFAGQAMGVSGAVSGSSPKIYKSGKL